MFRQLDIGDAAFKHPGFGREFGIIHGIPHRSHEGGMLPAGYLCRLIYQIIGPSQAGYSIRCREKLFFPGLPLRRVRVEAVPVHDTYTMAHIARVRILVVKQAA